MPDVQRPHRGRDSRDRIRCSTAEAISVLLGGGEFGPEDVALVATTLSVFALSVPFESLSHLLSRAIYATRHTLLQVLASVAGLVITIVVTSLTVGELDILAIPLGFAVGQVAKTVLLAVALRVRVRAMRPGEPVQV